jgi:hypothetical protein
MFDAKDEKPWLGVPVAFPETGLLRAETLNVGADFVTAMNKDTAVETIDDLMWTQLKNYNWEANDQPDNPLMWKNAADESKRMQRPFLEEELDPIREETAVDILESADTQLAVYHTNPILQGRATEEFMPVVPYEGQAASSDSHQTMIKDETDVELQFHDVFLPDWYSLGERSAFKVMTASAGTQLTDPERLTGTLDCYNWNAHQYQNQFIFETSS